MGRIEEFLQERKNKNLLRNLRAATFHKEGKIYRPSCGRFHYYTI